MPYVTDLDLIQRHLMQMAVVVVASLELVVALVFLLVLVQKIWAFHLLILALLVLVVFLVVMYPAHLVQAPLSYIHMMILVEIAVAVAVVVAVGPKVVVSMIVAVVAASSTVENHSLL